MTDPTAPDWKALYESEAAKFQAETLHSWTRGEIIRRLYNALAGAWSTTAAVSEEARRRFFLDGFPPNEREVLLQVLSTVESAWILHPVDGTSHD